MKAVLYKLLPVFGLFTALLLLSSCRDDFETTPSEGNLVFSKDTVYLDTVFSNIGSSTYRLKVYNPSDNLIDIPSLGLERGENSQYRLNVDGISGKNFSHIEVLPKDSIFIFIETTLDYNALEADSTRFLYTDVLNFDTGARQQQIPLITLVQDAVFLYPQRDSEGIEETLSLGSNASGEELQLRGFYLDADELVFTNEKPYVIYGYAGVPSGNTLRIEAGARLHFHEESGIIVARDATLQVNGAASKDTLKMENEVIFEGDRLEPVFEDVQGQWGSIWLTTGSKNNSINHATIKNATVGILADANAGNNNPTLSIKNTQIYNSATTGLLAQTAIVRGENLVINNSGISSMWLTLGGDYVFKHTTIANYWQQSFRQAAALQIDNFTATEEGALAANLIQARFENCIITGNRGEEIQFAAIDEVQFNISFVNSLIQFSNPLQDNEERGFYDFENESYYNNVILNGEPEFLNTTENDLRISEESAANATALPAIAREVPLDILGTSRSTTEPDMGAYESIVIEKE